MISIRRDDFPGPLKTRSPPVRSLKVTWSFRDPPPGFGSTFIGDTYILLAFKLLRSPRSSREVAPPRIPSAVSEVIRSLSLP